MAASIFISYPDIDCDTLALMKIHGLPCKCCISFALFKQFSSTMFTCGLIWF